MLVTESLIPDLPPAPPAPPPPAVPWSLRGSWIVTLLSVPAALLAGGAALLIQDSSTRTTLALTATELGFLLPLLIYMAWRRIGWRSLGFRAFGLPTLAIGCGALVVTYSLTIVHNSILLALRWHTQAETILRFLQSAGSPWGLVLGGIVVGPLAEELVFRGFFFQGLRQAHGSTKAVLISSAVFATIHLEPAAFIPTFLLGCTLAFVFDRSSSVWPGAILHVLLNAAGIGALLLMPQFSPR
jgi:uncharacterized protein